MASGLGVALGVASARCMNLMCLKSGVAVFQLTVSWGKKGVDPEILSLCSVPELALQFYDEVENPTNRLYW